MAISAQLKEQVDVLCVMEKSIKLDYVGMVHIGLDFDFVGQLLDHLLSLLRL